MAVVSYQRIVSGTGVSGKFGESLQITERWQIRCDSPQTSKMEMLQTIAAGGVTYGLDHWEFPGHKAMEFDLSPEGSDGLRWLVTAKFYQPAKQPDENGIPIPVWERSGGTTNIPALDDANGDPIVNSANDPLEGFSKEREESSFSLTKCYDTEEDFELAVADYAGKVNSDAWAGGEAKTWKCYFKGASKKSVSKMDGIDDGGTLEFIESRWEFRYDPTTWKLLPLDIGFMELVSSEKKTILGDDGKPVKQPVALTSTGAAATPGTAPSVTNGGDGVDIYETADWSSHFGTPTLL